MDALGLADITALVSALAVLLGALGAMTVKISRCVAELREQQIKVAQQTVRMRHETRQAGTNISGKSDELMTDIGSLKESVDRLSNMFMERSGITDRKFERVFSRLERVERDRE